MKFNALTKSELNTEIVFIFEDNNKNFDIFNEMRERKIFRGELETSYFIIDKEKNYLAIGLGKKNNLNVDHFNKSIKFLYKQLKIFNISNFLVNMNFFDRKYIHIFVQLIINCSYTFNKFKSKKILYKLNQIDIIIKSSMKSKILYDINVAQAIAHGQNYAKDLTNLPANICTTTYLLNEAKKLMNSNPYCSIHYIDESKIDLLEMNCIKAVGNGSSMPTYIVCMEYYAGKKEEKPIVLVGKGLVYDTGGLCIKPWKSMSAMKMDMAGAASIFGAIQAIINLKLPINVIGAVALVENSIGSNSFRPGDVLKSMKGITVEVGNTDAEGRLALCDTLTYINRYNPKTVIDIATLTGAMMVALGGDINGFFSNDEKLIDDIKKAAKESLDHVWHMPLHETYYQQLESNIADISNIGGSSAGSITAALFLSKFIDKYSWAHLDIAGSAMTDSNKSNVSSGRPVPMLVQYLINQAS